MGTSKIHQLHFFSTQVLCGGVLVAAGPPVMDLGAISLSHQYSHEIRGADIKSIWTRYKFDIAMFSYTAALIL